MHVSEVVHPSIKMYDNKCQILLSKHSSHTPTTTLDFHSLYIFLEMCYFYFVIGCLRDSYEIYNISSKI